MFTVIPDEELELQLYSVFARTARQVCDRRGDVAAVDHRTGLPTSANDLLPRYKAVSGVGLALQLIVVPRQFAASMLRRPVPVEQSESGHVALQAIPATQWTASETELVEALTEQIKIKVHQLAESKGHFNPHGEEFEPGRPLLGDDGLTCGFKITYKGLMHAIEKVRGTKYETGATNVEADLGRGALKGVQWAQQEKA
jgi:hypothetical protein